MDKYSKVYTQFETQSMAFGRLKVALKDKNWFVRGYDGHLMVYQHTEDSSKPFPIMKIIVKSSSSPDESGFFEKGKGEWLLIGLDEAWKVGAHVLPRLVRGA